MTYYAGYLYNYGIKLAVIGDGTQKVFIIDLSKQPFGIPFQGRFPIGVHVYSDEPIVPVPLASITSSSLTLEYPDPVPAPAEGTISPRDQLTIVLLYEPMHLT